MSEEASDLSIADALAKVVSEHGAPDDGPWSGGDGDGEASDTDESQDGSAEPSTDSDDGADGADDSGDGESDPEEPEETDEDRKRRAAEARGWRAKKRRQQAELRRQSDELSAKEEQLARAEKSLRTKYDKFFRAAEAAEKEDFLGVAKALGVDPSKLNEALFDDLTGKDPKVRELERRLAEREKREAERERRIAEREKREAEEREKREIREKVESWESQLADHFLKTPKLARLAKEKPLLGLVRQTQENHYSETGKVLAPEKAWERLAPALSREYDALRELLSADGAESPTDGAENESRQPSGRAPTDEAENESRQPSGRAGQGRPRKRTQPRNRAEARPPSDGMVSDSEWLRKWASKMRSTED